MTRKYGTIFELGKYVLLLGYSVQCCICSHLLHRASLSLATHSKPVQLCFSCPPDKQWRWIFSLHRSVLRSSRSRWQLSVTTAMCDILMSPVCRLCYVWASWLCIKLMMLAVWLHPAEVVRVSVWCMSARTFGTWCRVAFSGSFVHCIVYLNSLTRGQHLTWAADGQIHWCQSLAVLMAVYVELPCSTQTWQNATSHRMCFCM